jgi:hypothetical protein
MDDDRFKSIASQKCPTCFRKDECWLLRDKHAGIELCLGPFKDQEDLLRKLKEDREEEAKPKADIAGLVRKSRQFQYWLNKVIFESESGGGKRKPDDPE